MVITSTPYSAAQASNAENGSENGDINQINTENQNNSENPFLSSNTMPITHDNLRSRTTNNGHHKAACLYNSYTEKHEQAKFDDLKPPIQSDLESIMTFKSAITGFAFFMATEAKTRDGKPYEPKSAKQNFSSLFNAFKNEPRFAAFSEPTWYKGLCGQVEKVALERKKAMGAVESNESVKKAIRRAAFKELLFAIFGESTSKTETDIWTKM